MNSLTGFIALDYICLGFVVVIGLIFSIAFTCAFCAKQDSIDKMLNSLDQLEQRCLDEQS